MIVDQIHEQLNLHIESELRKPQKRNKYARYEEIRPLFNLIIKQHIFVSPESRLDQLELGSSSGQGIACFFCYLNRYDGAYWTHKILMIPSR